MQQSNQQRNDIFVEAANVIGARLCRDAVWASERCNWLGDAMQVVGNAWTVVHRAFESDLYSGTSGIALFLARLFDVTRERIYRITAEGALRQALSGLEEISPTARAGFYSGWTGIASVSIALGQIFDNQRYIDQALHMLEELAHDDPNQQGLDVIAGSAGAIPALLNIHRKYPNDVFVDLAIRHGEHLLNTARKSDIGWSWDTLDTSSSGQQHDLTGFSHGTAGIGWALLELYRETQQERFRVGAEHAFQYERHWFDARHENWPDFRDLSGPAAGGTQAPAYMVAWCHGAPGIGLSRLRAYEILGEEACRSEAEAAIRTTTTMLHQSADAGQGNYSLCHGLAGNAELLVYASQVFGEARYMATAARIGEQGIEQYQEKSVPWPCGVPGGGETPGLMLGLAGIGYFYLRLYDPVRNPPVVIIVPEQGFNGERRA